MKRKNSTKEGAKSNKGLRQKVSLSKRKVSIIERKYFHEVHNHHDSYLSTEIAKYRNIRVIID